MTKPLRIERCKSESEFIRQVQGHPRIVKERWAGDHYTVETDGGRITLCNHHYELPPYLRRKIVKALLTLGLAVFAALLIMPQ